MEMLSIVSDMLLCGIMQFWRVSIYGERNMHGLHWQQQSRFFQHRLLVLGF